MMVLKNYGEPLMRLGILNHAEVNLGRAFSRIVI